MIIHRDLGRENTKDDFAFTVPEATLVILWERLPFQDDITSLRISRSTDFFAAGGSSLLLVDLQHLILGEFKVFVPLKDLSQLVQSKMSTRISAGLLASSSSLPP